jgi:hypothetical protein
LKPILKEEEEEEEEDQYKKTLQQAILAYIYLGL